MKNFLLPVILTFSLSLFAQAAPPEDKALAHVFENHDLLVKENWAYLKLKIQQESAYELFKKRTRMGKIIQKGLKQIEVLPEGDKKRPIIAATKKYYALSQKLYDKTMANTKGLAKTNHKDYESKKSLIENHFNIVSQINQMGDSIKIYRDLEIPAKEDYHEFKKNADLALNHREKLHLILTRLLDKKEKVLALISREKQNYSVDSLSHSLTMDYENSMNDLESLERFEQDEQLITLTREFLDFYLSDLTDIIAHTQEYYTEKERYDVFWKEFTKLDPKTMGQATYDDYKARFTQIKNLRNEWMQKRVNFRNTSHSKHAQWSEEGLYFVESYLYQNVPTYKKPSRHNIWVKK